MNARLSIVALVATALCAPLAAAQQRLYRWVDENGVVHYGDRVPPEYADRDRSILNSHGVPIGREEGELTDAERAQAEQKRAKLAAEQAARAEVARRDRMLLETYLSVEDIVDLRDRRLELLEGQITVTEVYLTNLRERLQTLKAEAGRYKPFSDRPNAQELPADLAAEIRSTESSIASYERTIERTRSEQARLKAQFDSDIERFRELKGG